MAYKGKWYSRRCYFGFHEDLHVNMGDTNIGAGLTEQGLMRALKLAKADFVQTDAKGHFGMTSWPSKVPGSTVGPGLKKDRLKILRSVSRKLGIPLHCHYSGIWDEAASRRHPEMRVVRHPRFKINNRVCLSPKYRKAAEVNQSEMMCPRGPYLEKLMLPQLFELIDRYGVDGFWVDGEIWAVEPCYCEKCKAEFTRRTSITEPPTDTADANWVAWINFVRESFEEYVTRYCDALHSHKKGVFICSNWLQSLAHPGEPNVPTDWISGDALSFFGLDSIRVEARFISTRGKPWDIMLWGSWRAVAPEEGDLWSFFHATLLPSAKKPTQMFQQEVAGIIVFGGNFMISFIQVFELTNLLRDERLPDWVMKRLGKVAAFAGARRNLCQGTETLPQIAVLHSEYHLRSQPVKQFFLGEYDATGVMGALYSLLENSFAVDVMDEWALLGRINDFPLVVAPEQHNMSDKAVETLKDYVRAGGKLLVNGSRAFDRFGAEFLGVKSVRVEKDAGYYLLADDGAAQMISEEWRMLKPTSARPLKRLRRTSILDKEIIPFPVATINKVGRGAVAYAPFDLFRFFSKWRFPLTRAFVGELVRAMRPRFDIKVKAPVCVDVVLRRKKGKQIIHFLNRLSGIPNQPHNGAVDEIPLAGPIRVEMKCSRRPKKVKLAFSTGTCRWRYKSAEKKKNGGTLTTVISAIHIHSALVVEV